MKALPHIASAAVFLFSVAFSAVFTASAANGDDLRLKTVVIDAGHGGKDPGCVSRDGKVLEKNINLDIAKKLGSKISAAWPDVKVIYTRSTDVFVPLNERAAIANRNNANLFISIHVNAATTTQAHGFSTHILGNDRFSSNQDLVRRENSVIMLEEDYTTNYQGFDPDDPESFIFFNLMQNAYYEQSLSFAAEVDKSLSKGPVAHSRGVSQNLFLVLWKTTMPAVLVEVGFMSNASDLKILNSASSRNQIAQCLFNAFRTFKAKYDASLDYAAEASSSSGQDTYSETTEDGFGVQIFVLGKKLPSSDPAFKGHKAEAVRAGDSYKYIIRAVSAEGARKLFRQMRKEFPGSFPVRIEGGKVSAL